MRPRCARGPYNLVLARPRDERALRELAAAVDDVPGVSEATPEAYDFARVWGRPFRLVMEQNVFALEQVIEPPTRDRRATSR